MLLRCRAQFAVQFPSDPQQQHATSKQQADDVQQLGCQEREGDQADESDADAESQHAFAIPRRQPCRKRAEHDDIVARQHQIDHDHLEQRCEPGRAEDIGDAEVRHWGGVAGSMPAA